jgi:hypothetical protein
MIPAAGKIGGPATPQFPSLGQFFGPLFPNRLANFFLHCEKFVHTHWQKIAHYFSGFSSILALRRNRKQVPM